MSVCTAQLRTAPMAAPQPRASWISFLLQIGLVASVEVSDDLLRGMVAEHDSSIGIGNATRVVEFETAHGFFVEPAWQQFFQHNYHLFGLTLGWPLVTSLANTMYTVGHVGITFGFAMWVYFYRRGLFSFVRNIFFGANALALVLYELYPMAPPRLTPGLRFDGHPYKMLDPLFSLLGADGKLQGTKLGYDEFAAMPSLHMAWALIVGVTLFVTLRPLAPRLLALLYPVVMLATVVVTGNHYLMDAVGAAAVVIVAALLALALRWRQTGRGSLADTARDLWALRFGPIIPQAAASARTGKQAPARIAA